MSPPSTSLPPYNDQKWDKSVDSHTRDNEPPYNMIYNGFLVLDQLPNHTMTSYLTMTSSNNDSYTSQQCLFNSRKIDSFTILQYWLLTIADAWLGMTSWSLAGCWGIVVLASSNGTLTLHALLVCFWIVLKCPPSCTCVNKQDPNQYTNKILTLSCKTYVKKKITI